MRIPFLEPFGNIIQDTEGLDRKGNYRLGREVAKQPFPAVLDTKARLRRDKI